MKRERGRGRKRKQRREIGREGREKWRIKLSVYAFVGKKCFLLENNIIIINTSGSRSSPYLSLIRKMRNRHEARGEEIWEKKKIERMRILEAKNEKRNMARGRLEERDDEEDNQWWKEKTIPRERKQKGTGSSFALYAIFVTVHFLLLFSFFSLSVSFYLFQFLSTSSPDIIIVITILDIDCKT